jgi:hypothetical protein
MSLRDLVAGSADRRLEAECEMMPHGAATVPGEVVGARFTRAVRTGAARDLAQRFERDKERESSNEVRTERSVSLIR